MSWRGLRTYPRPAPSAPPSLGMRIYDLAMRALWITLGLLLLAGFAQEACAFLLRTAMFWPAMEAREVWARVLAIVYVIVALSLIGWEAYRDHQDPWRLARRRRNSASR